MSKVAFVGGGSFGTALSVLLSNKGNKVTIYDRDEEVVKDINNNKNNKKYFEVPYKGTYPGLLLMGKIFTAIAHEGSASMHVNSD